MRKWVELTLGGNAMPVLVFLTLHHHALHKVYFLHAKQIVRVLFLMLIPQQDKKMGSRNLV